MKMNRRTILTLAMGLLAASALAFASGCGDDDSTSSAPLTKVTLMLNWTPNTQHSGIYIAQMKGWYKEQGIDLQILDAPASGGVEQLVGEGKADFGISVEENVIPARAESVPIVSIAAILQHNDSSLMSLQTSNIKRPKDFEGKTYGGYGGPLENQIIKTLVTCDGGDPSKVNFVEVGNIDYLAGMQAKQFDFVWVFQGWDVLRAAQVQQVPVNSVTFKDWTKCIPDWYTPVIITSESMIKNKPDLVRKFMAATSQGYDVAGTDSKTAADALIAGAPESDQQLVTQSAAYHLGKYVDAGRQWGLQDLSIWQNFAKFLKDAGVYDKDVDVTKAFTNDFLPKK
jgi:ABC-type nitrate/sulfonate/bicarbonate transport system substrate-binding protein